MTMTRGDKIRLSSNNDLAFIISTLIVDSMQTIGGLRFKNQDKFFRAVSDITMYVENWLDGKNDLTHDTDNSRILNLPCAIGEKFYIVDMGKIKVVKVKSILWKGYDEQEGYRYFMTIGDCSYVESDIGKTIFRTWKEAQDYLAKTKPKE